MGANQSIRLKSSRKQYQSCQRKNSRGSQDSGDSNVDLNLVTSNGRIFLKNSNNEYLLAVDDIEADRLHKRHHTQWHVWKSHFSSPVKTLLNLGNMNVLDVGCGPATWLMDMATEYPQSHFTGVDIVPLYPADRMPDNLTFIQANVMEDLPFEDGSFDYIYVNDLLAYFPGKCCKEQIFPDLLRLLKPGGWLEITEYERKLYETGPNTEFLMDKLSTVFHNRGASGIPVYEILPDLFQNDDDLIEFRREDKFVKYCDFQLTISEFTYVFSTLKNMILEFTSMNSAKYDEILSCACKELLKHKTSFHVTRFYAQKRTKELQLI